MPVKKRKDKKADEELEKFERRLTWYKNRGHTRKLAIHAFCFECAGGSTKDVKDCPSKTCTLYPFRLGSDSGKANKNESQRILYARKQNATKMNRGKKKEDPDD